MKVGISVFLILSLFIAGLVFVVINEERAEVARKEAVARIQEQEFHRKREVLIKDAITNREVIVGMTPSDVILAIGSPDFKESKIEGDDRYEIWSKGKLSILFMDSGGMGKLKVVRVKEVESP